MAGVLNAETPRRSATRGLRGPRRSARSIAALARGPSTMPDMGLPVAMSIPSTDACSAWVSASGRRSAERASSVSAPSSSVRAARASPLVIASTPSRYWAYPR
jgi:hypothetical protein